MTKKFINSRYHGRYHELSHIKNESTVYELKENEIYVSALWAGGWDEYLVDMNTVRLMTDQEKETKYQPVVNGFLRAQYSNKQIPEGYCAKAIRHFAGGD